MPDTFTKGFSQTFGPSFQMGARSGATGYERAKAYKEAREAEERERGWEHYKSIVEQLAKMKDRINVRSAYKALIGSMDKKGYLSDLNKQYHMSMATGGDLATMQSGMAELSNTIANRETLDQQEEKRKAEIVLAEEEIKSRTDLPENVRKNALGLVKYSPIKGMEYIADWTDKKMELASKSNSEAQKWQVEYDKTTKANEWVKKLENGEASLLDVPDDIYDRVYNDMYKRYSRETDAGEEKKSSITDRIVIDELRSEREGIAKIESVNKDEDEYSTPEQIRAKAEQNIMGDIESAQKIMPQQQKSQRPGFDEWMQSKQPQPEQSVMDDEFQSFMNQVKHRGGLTPEQKERAKQRFPKHVAEIEAL